MNAGISLDKALESLAKVDQPAVGRFSENVYRGIATGSTLSESFERATSSFGPAVISMVKAGEQSGRLVFVLLQLSDRLERAQQIRNQLVSALSYPAAILAGGGVMLVFMTTYMLPRLLSTIGSIIDSPPWPTRVLMALADSGGLIFSLLLMFACSVPWFLSDVSAASRFRNWILFESPVVGTIGSLSEQARLSAEFSMLIEAGMTVTAAMSNLSPSDPTLKDALGEATQGLHSGLSLSESFEKTGRFRKDFVALLEVGEETGRLSQVLKHQADYLEDLVGRLTGDSIKLLEPIAMMVLGFVVSFVILGSFLPVYQLVSQNL